VRRVLFKALLTALGLVLAVVILLPFVWAFSASLQTETAIVRRPPDWIPQPASVENYRYVFTGEVPSAYAVRGLLRSPITQEARVLPWGLRNSLTVAVGVVILNLVFGSIAAYTLAREQFRGRIASFYFILGSRLLPPIAVAIPTYMILSRMGLLDTRIALVLVHTAFTLPLTIWVLTMYFRALPEEIEQAALVDGCNRLQVLTKIVLPLSLPGLAATGAFAFMISYGEFILAVFLTRDLGARTVPVVLSSAALNFDVSFALASTAVVIACLPPVLFALLFRNYILGGLSMALGRH
jgi:multiple sugar transport system permease protein